MKVLVLFACLAAAAVAQVQHAGHTGHAGHTVTHYEKVVETSSHPEYLVHQQPASLLKSVQQVPVTGYQQTTYVSGQQPASYFKTVEKIENPALLNTEVQKFEKIENVNNVQLPAVAAYSGGYEHSAYIQKQPALASLSGYKTVVAQPAVTTFEKQFVSSTPAPLISTYTSNVPLTSSSSYKQQTAYVSQPAISTYKKEIFSAPAVSSYSAFPAASAYKQESTVYSAQPAVSSYSAFPAASSYKQESTVYSAKPAVTSFSTFPAASSYKQESTVYSAKPAVSSYSAFPAASAYKQESNAYKQESTVYSANPSVSAYGAAFHKDSHLYSQSSAKYGGSAMFPGNYQSADGGSSILKIYKDDDGAGVYQYGYATSNGINHDEQGKVLASGSKSAEGSSAVSGSYSYQGPDGVTYTVNYVADEQGFRAVGDHLPKLSVEAQHAIDESAKYGEQKDY